MNFDSLLRVAVTFLKFDDVIVREKTCEEIFHDFFAMGSEPKLAQNIKKNCLICFAIMFKMKTS